jgi:hypothetical protein
VRSRLVRPPAPDDAAGRETDRSEPESHLIRHRRPPGSLNEPDRPHRRFSGARLPGSLADRHDAHQHGPTTPHSSLEGLATPGPASGSRGRQRPLHRPVRHAQGPGRRAPRRRRLGSVCRSSAIERVRQDPSGNRQGRRCRAWDRGSSPSRTRIRIKYAEERDAHQVERGRMGLTAKRRSCLPRPCGR